MRISDWSSDVCSSDLVVVQRVARYRQLEGEGFAKPAQQLIRISTARSGIDPACRLSVPQPGQYECGEPREGGMAVDRRRGQEMGRASCRRRVCQEGSISVVAGLLKNKKNIKVK